MSISAYYVLRRRHLDFARTIVHHRPGFRGDFQPRHRRSPATSRPRRSPTRSRPSWPPWRATTRPAPPTSACSASPTRTPARVDYAVAVPGGLSFLVHEDFNAAVPGLDQFPKEDWPNVPLVFQTYHLMVGLGAAFIGLTLLALFFLWRGTLFEKRWLMGVFVVAVVGPYLANQAGWVSAEAGRQPFIVYPQVTWDDDKPPKPHMQMDERRHIPEDGRRPVQPQGGRSRSGARLDRDVQRDLRAAVRRLGLRAQQQDPARPRRGRQAAAARHASPATSWRRPPAWPTRPASR